MNTELINRAIESAKARIYKLSVDAERSESASHQRKIKKQTEVMQVTIEALEKQIPKKPTSAPDDNCPACGWFAMGGTYCRHCGQRLYWGADVSEDDLK